MGRREMIPHLEIDQVVVIQRRYPAVDDLVFVPELQHPKSRVADHAVVRGSGAHAEVAAEQNREVWRERAEAGVHDERSLVQRHGEQHMRARGLRARRDQHHARGMPDGMESQAFEQAGEERRVFEAIAATARMHEFGLNCIELEPYPPAEQHVEILEWDSGDVRTQKPGQCLEVRQCRSAVPNALEIAVEVERRRAHSLSTAVPAAIGSTRSSPRFLRLRREARSAKKTCSKMSTMHTVMNPRLIGFWKNTVRSPRDSNSARRKFSSTNGPST